MSATSEKSARLIRLPQVKQKTGYSRSSIYAKIPLDEFPAPVNLGARAVAWIESEIDEWINDRVKASRGGTSTGEVAR
ncbi:MAG TPA: AlpA family transcriptional regulator [Edaphobacter sp.]|nr:AlpA family transcriptional regulator [Edaphobacter sp.]